MGRLTRPISKKKGGTGIPVTRKHQEITCVILCRLIYIIMSFECLRHDNDCM